MTTVRSPVTLLTDLKILMYLENHIYDQNPAPGTYTKYHVAFIKMMMMMIQHLQSFHELVHTTHVQ